MEREKFMDTTLYPFGAIGAVDQTGIAEQDQGEQND